MFCDFVAYRSIWINQCKFHFITEDMLTKVLNFLNQINAKQIKTETNPKKLRKTQFVAVRCLSMGCGNETLSGIFAHDKGLLTSNWTDWGSVVINRSAGVALRGQSEESVVWRRWHKRARMSNVVLIPVTCITPNQKQRVFANLKMTVFQKCVS